MIPHMMLLLMDESEFGGIGAAVPAGADDSWYPPIMKIERAGIRYANRNGMQEIERDGIKQLERQ